MLLLFHKIVIVVFKTDYGILTNFLRFLNILPWLDFQHLKMTIGHLQIASGYLGVNSRYLEMDSRYLEIISIHLD